MVCCSFSAVVSAFTLYNTLGAGRVLVGFSTSGPCENSRVESEYHGAIGGMIALIFLSAASMVCMMIGGKKEKKPDESHGKDGSEATGARA